MLTNADAGFIEGLRRALPASALREVSQHYLEEPRGKWTGQAGVVVAPANVEEVATAIRAAAVAHVPVVPFGGGTGLVGGQILPDGPLPMLLSLERMTAIRATYPDEAVLIAEAGATVEAIQVEAAEHALLFPLSYASQGSAQIGAGLSVNSGGLNVLRYGTARQQCLGIEAVLPDGSIYRGLKRLRKDNTGYDLKDLLIGAEGTLGVITAACLALAPRPERRATGFLAVDNPRAALSLLARLRAAVGEAVSAFELISATGLDFLARHFPDLRQPFAMPPPWSVLVEIGTGAQQDPDEVLADVFSGALNDGLVTDGHLAQSDTQRAEFWAVRETIPLANRKTGAIASHDIALPLSSVADFIDDTVPRLAQIAPMQLNAFGHLGDGNLHFNLFPPEGRTKSEMAHLAPEVTRLVHDQVAAFDGSFSAEHGVGRLKVEELERYGDPARLAAMRAIKDALDPAGIMNPGAVLRATK